MGSTRKTDKIKDMKVDDRKAGQIKGGQKKNIVLKGN